MALAGEEAMTAEIVTKSASWIAQRVSNRSLSCCEVMETFVGHIGELNPVLNAICTLNNQAMEQAHEADRQLALGQPPRPLEGVPILVKDTLHTKGIRTTFGSLIREHYVPEEDALSVERLKNAGAIVLGKTNTPEFAHDVNTNNLIFGTTRNPFDVNVTAGGRVAAQVLRLQPLWHQLHWELTWADPFVYHAHTMASLASDLPPVECPCTQQNSAGTLWSNMFKGL